MGIELNEDMHWRKWIGFVREALSCLDKDHKWAHLPNSGGYYDQDEFYLVVWEYIIWCRQILACLCGPWNWSRSG